MNLKENIPEPRMETFTTYITFTSGDSHKEQPITSDQVESTIYRLMRGPAAMMGMIKEVKIVDELDCIVFLAKGNKVVFPPQQQYKPGV